MIFIAASVFLVAGLAYAVWCVVVTMAGGFKVGTLGMALLSAALCYQALVLIQGRRNARLFGIVGAAALAIGSSASAALVALPWLSAKSEAAIPRVLWPTLALLLATATAFVVAAAVLIYDRHAHR